MAQHIKSNGFRLDYFDSHKHGEVDFVIQNGMGVDLVEIKSGNDYKRHTALNNVLATEEWKFNKVYVFCKDNIQAENGILYLPWYMIMFVKPAKIPSGLLYEVDISELNNINK